MITRPATAAGHAGQITTITIICAAIACFLFYLGLLALADAEERANQDREYDRREKAIMDSPLNWPPLEAADEEMSA